MWCWQGGSLALASVRMTATESHKWDFYNFLGSISEFQFPHEVINGGDQSKVYTGK